MSGTTGPLAVTAPPAALYYASRDRRASIPSGIFKLHRHPAGRRLQRLQRALRSLALSGSDHAGTVLGACARRQFFELADIAANARRGKNAAAISPIALEAVKRIDALFDIERDINGLSAEERLRVRQEQSAPFWPTLESLAAGAALPPVALGLRSPSRSTTCSSAGDRFARFLEDGRICLTNNAAERALRGFALGRKSWLFAGSERGADRAAAMATLIMTRRSRTRACSTRA